MSMLDFLTKFGIDKHAVTNGLELFLPNLISAAGVIVFAILFYMITARLLETALRRTHMQSSLVRISVRSLYRGLVIVLGIIFVLSQLGINVTAALAGVGVIGIAVGFAAQATLANIFSGFGIFIEHLYRKGDWVSVAGNYGEVANITLRTTKIKTLDNTYISIPNSVVTSSAVTNFSEQGEVRISAKVSISYKESIDVAREVLIEGLKKIDGIRQTPAPEVVVEELDDSGVNLLARIWIDNPRFEQRFTFELTETCKKVLDEAGIAIPFPQRDVHMIK